MDVKGWTSGGKVAKGDGSKRGHKKEVAKSKSIAHA
jgi:hypothetical protein